MATVGRVVGAGVLVVGLLGGAYLTADAYDMVPGGITLDPVPPGPSPFPAIPGVARAAAADPAPALGDPDPAVPMPAAGLLQAQVDALVADPRLGPATGIVVADQLTGEVLAANLADQPRTPASTTKLLTATAALGTLDPTMTLPTTVVEGAGDDELVLVGGGDMMLAAGAGDPTAVNGRAGLADLATLVAKDLQLRGTTSVRLRFDDTLFPGSRTAAGWTTAQVDLGYVAPVTSLAVDLARTRTDVEYAPRAQDPSLQAARAFADRLAEAGITVEGAPTRATAASDARVIGEVRSAPLAELVRFMLTTSDNTQAEVVGRLVAIGQGLPASFSGGTQAVVHAVSTLGVDTAGIHLGDCSGLASGSAIAPRQLVAALALVLDGQHQALRDVAVGMPIAGLTGTLFDRFTGTPAAGLLRAKTGSLPGVTSLAGTLVTADGRRLVFAVMADGTPAGGQVRPRQAIDAFVSGLAACGCR